MKTIYINKKANNHINQYESDGIKYDDLISYGTRVAYLNHNEKFIHINGWFSATTAKHINDFLEFHGAERMTKSQMLQSPTVEL